MILRSPELTDLDDLSLIYASEVVNRRPYCERRDRVQTPAALERNVARPREICEQNVLRVVAVHRDSGRVIGDFILNWTSNEHRHGEIGGSLHSDFHGHCYAAEVYRELLNIGFTDYSLHGLVGRRDGRNGASIRSLEKAGLRQEAHSIENVPVKGESTDEVVLAIRSKEWERPPGNPGVGSGGLRRPNP